VCQFRIFTQAIGMPAADPQQPFSMVQKHVALPFKNEGF
jgi:hypothetical protein